MNYLATKYSLSSSQSSVSLVHIQKVKLKTLVNVYKEYYGMKPGKHLFYFKDQKCL